VLLRLGIALAAVALVGAAASLLLWLALPISAPVAPKSPFGMGVREAAPAATGLGGTILVFQASFYRALQAALEALKASGSGAWTLMGLGFAYGVFHAAGPGHGKAVISAYLVASGRALSRGLALSVAAALVQAVVAIAVVGIAALILRQTAATMSRTVNTVEIASFWAVAAVGALLTWRKAGKFLGALDWARGASGSAPGCEGGECGHAPVLPPPDAGPVHWREFAGIVLGAGIRPCAGAIVVLVFALSQNLFWAGVAATFAMALGTAVTTSAIAALAVLAKGVALRIAGGRGTSGAVAMAGIELLAASLVLVLGASLVFGVAAGGMPS
jgi:nickel/cobalt exporter